MEVTGKDSPRRSLVNVGIGQGVRIGDFADACDCEIGDGSTVGSFVELRKNVRIGKHWSISGHAFIWEGVEIGDEVIVGRHGAFINGGYPGATNSEGSMQTEAGRHFVPTRVKRRASIAINRAIFLLAECDVCEYLSQPIDPALSDEQIAYVAQSINSFPKW